MVECLVQHLVPQSIFLEMIDNIVSVYHIGYGVLKYIHIVQWLNATNEMHHFSLERESAHLALHFQEYNISSLAIVNLPYNRSLELLPV